MLKQSTARNLSVFVTQSADHFTGLTGATLTINASKDGAAFGAITPTVTELANGWYSLALTTAHTNTLGDLIFHITATSADPCDLRENVVADLPGASVASVTGAVGSVTGAVGSVTGAVGSVTATVAATVAGAVGSVTGNVGGNVVGSVASVTATVSANMVGIIATALTEGSAGYLAAAFKKFFNLASPSSTMNEITLVDTVTTYTGNTVQTGDSFARLGAPAGASIAADLAEIEAETDGIAAIPTTPLLAASYTAPNNSGITTIITTLGSPAGASVSADIAEIEVETDSIISTLAAGVTVTTNSDKTGYSLAAAQVPFKKNTALAGFTFPMFSSAGAALTGLTVTAQRIIDGGAIASCTNAVVEVSNGIYKIDFAAGDLNGNSITFLMNATSALETTFTAVTQ